MTQLGGIVLCGGQSRRMGRAKAWLPFGKEVMLQRVVRILGEVVAPLVVVAAPEQQVPPLPAGAVLVRDEERGRGPLQGLVAGLMALSGRVDAACLTGCDAPFLRPGLVQRLGELLGAHSICMPRIGDRLHPLAAVYRMEVVAAVRRLLANDRLRLTLLVEEVPTRVVDAAELTDVDPALDSFRNLNTVEDYEAALVSAGCF